AHELGVVTRALLAETRDSPQQLGGGGRDAARPRLDAQLTGQLDGSHVEHVRPAAHRDRGAAPGARHDVDAAAAPLSRAVSAQRVGLYLATERALVCEGLAMHR